jgi:methyltransferase-like protein
LTNKYWVNCYNCIRRHYPENKILIIDDNSNPQYLSPKILYNTLIINSEYHNRGELLPYYYYLQNHFFDTAVILHDSVFINRYIDFNVDKYKLIWDFEPDLKPDEDESDMIKIFDNPELNAFYENKSLWKGCFGAMSIITYDFLQLVNNKYDLSKLLHRITNRNNRCSFERVIACLLQMEYRRETLLGNIYRYCPWGILFDQKYIFDDLPITKVWTGR